MQLACRTARPPLSRRRCATPARPAQTPPPSLLPTRFAPDVSRSELLVLIARSRRAAALWPSPSSTRSSASKCLAPAASTAAQARPCCAPLESRTPSREHLRAATTGSRGDELQTSARLQLAALDHRQALRLRFPRRLVLILLGPALCECSVRQDRCVEEMVPSRAAPCAEGLLPASKSRRSTLERASTSPAHPRPFSSLADALSWFLTSRYLHCERRASRRAARLALSSLHVSAPGCARPSTHAESSSGLALSLASCAGRRAHRPVIRGLALLAGIQLPPAR